MRLISHEWQKTERFWRKAARYILGAPTRTSNEAVLGEIGWSTLWTRAAWQAAALWTRITRMPECALVRKAMFCCAWRRLLVNAFTKHISARIVVCVVIVFGMNGGTLQIFV